MLYISPTDSVTNISDLSPTHTSTKLWSTQDSLQIRPSMEPYFIKNKNLSPKCDWPKSSAKNGVFEKKKEIDIFISDNWLPVYSNTNTNGYSSIRRILIGYLIGLINVFIYLKWAIISGMWNRFIPERTRLSTVWMHRPKRGWPHVTSCDLSLIMSTANRVDQISIPHF